MNDTKPNLRILKDPAAVAAVAAVQQILVESDVPEMLPPQLVKPQSGELRWLLDRAAASQLSPQTAD
jgi:hypothetical protein